MNFQKRLMLALPAAILLLGLASCKIGVLSTEGQRPADTLSKSISDALHSSGNEHFFFLPPMVSPPETFNGDFDPTLSPEVTISPLGVTFTTQSGRGSEKVRVCPEEEHYIVNWHSKDFDLDEGTTYRITVCLEGTVLGYADVDVVDSGSQLQDVETSEYVALKNGRTLPIKFRIEEGAFEPPPEEFTVTEVRVTSSGDQESNPRLGSDASGPIVVYTSQKLTTDGSYTGDIYYQRLDTDGALSGPPVLISTELADDKFNDLSGSRIVYTAFESSTSVLSKLMLYDISAGTATPLLPEADAGLFREARNDGSVVVWTQGQNGVTQVLYRDLTWTEGLTVTLGGPTPPGSNVEIGNRFVVWEKVINSQKDITAYDRLTSALITVSSDPDFDDRLPSTSGTWVAWQAIGPTDATQIRMANLAIKPVTSFVAVEDSSNVGRPSIDGDLMAFESDAAGNLDVYLYRISDGKIFQVTSDPADQFLCNLYGNQVAYVDMRNDTLDIYVSTFTLPPVEEE